MPDHFGNHFGPHFGQHFGQEESETEASVVSTEWRQGWCTSFRAELFKAVHGLVSDTLKIALYDSNALLDYSVISGYQADNEISGSGYTAGGFNFPLMLAWDVDPPYIDFTTLNFGPFTASDVRGAIIYNQTQANRALAVLDFGRSLALSNQTLRLNSPGTKDFMRILGVDVSASAWQRGWTHRFRRDLGRGLVDVQSNSFKLALYNSDAQLDSTLNAYSATNEVSGGGYVAGGNAVTLSINESQDPPFLDFSDVSFQNVTESALRGGAIFQLVQGIWYGVYVIDFGDSFAPRDQNVKVIFPFGDVNRAFLKVLSA